MKKVTLILMVVLLIGCNQKEVTAQKPNFVDSLPKIEAIVTDFENVLSKEEEEQLTHAIIDFEAKTTNEIVIVTVKNIAPYDDIFDYSQDLANKTGVGKKDKNNGIMIVVCASQHKIQIQNGDGILPKLSNEQTKVILEQTILPEFKEGKYYNGLKNGIAEIIKALQ